MAKYDMNINNIMLALQAVQALPDEPFAPLMTDEVSEAIVNQLFVPISTRNTHLNAKDTKRLFGISNLEDIEELRKLSPRERANRATVFYKARYDITPERNKGALRLATQCFGMGDKAEDFINTIFDQAGISRIPNGGIGGGEDTVTAPSEPSSEKTEAQKRAKRMQKHKTGELIVQQSDVPVASATEVQPDLKERTQVKPAEVSVQSGTEEPEESKTKLNTKEGFWTYDTAKAIIEEDPEPYLIHGLIRKGSIVTIPATQNSGKTLLVMDMMGAVASGANFLPNTDGKGGFETEQGACIFLDFEGDRSDTASRMLATLETYAEETGKDVRDIPLTVRWMPTDWYGSDDNFPYMVHSTIASLPEPYNKPALIGFDTYTAFSDVENENDRTQATKVFNRLKTLRQLFSDTNVTIVITAHLRKQNGATFENMTMDDIAGAGTQGAATSDIWLLAETKEDKTIKKFRQVKNKARARDDEIKVLQFRYENNNDGSLSRARFFMLTGTDANKAREKISQVKQRNEVKRETEVLAFIATHPKCTLNRICKGDKEGKDRLKMNLQTAKPIVDMLIDAGKIYNLSPDSSSYCLVINPMHKDDTDQNN